MVQDFVPEFIKGKIWCFEGKKSPHHILEIEYF